jgi:hypothetical protein
LKRIVLIALVIAILFTVLSAGCLGSKPKLAVTAERLYYDYITDAAAADELYKGTKIQITGVITHLGTDSTGSGYVILDVGDLSDTWGVQLSLAPKYAAIVSSLSVGQQMTIAGTCWGYSNNVIVLVK